MAFQRILGLVMIGILIGSFALAQDSSIKYIMPYETDRLFADQITEYQTYYTAELAINTFAIEDLTKSMTFLSAQKQSGKVRRQTRELEEDLVIQEKLKNDLQYYLDVWLEIEEFYDNRMTTDFIAEYNPATCYRLYTLYDTLEVNKNDITLRKKNKGNWMEYPEAIDAEYIEDVRVITPASTQWVKKKADRNCLSADPNDCLVWCLVEIPEEVEVLSRKLHVISCPVTYEISEDRERCEKEISYTGELSDASEEMAIYSKALLREIEILSWEKITCR